MKCIVTAGPTYEELDKVRRLTNFSTGELGIGLANHLVEKGHHVELLRGHYSTSQLEPKAQSVLNFTTTSNLMRNLEGLASPEVGAVFHAAAVSDFGFGRIWRRSADGTLVEVKSAKIPTRGERVLVELPPTPKIILKLRDWFPEARLIGWKYELEGRRENVIALGERQLAENRTNACVVNGAAYGTGYGLVTGLGRCQDCPDKTSLFEALEKFATLGD